LALNDRAPAVAPFGGAAVSACAVFTCSLIIGAAVFGSAVSVVARFGDTTVPRFGVASLVSVASEQKASA
jgi:hypothetical protein